MGTNTSVTGFVGVGPFEPVMTLMVVSEDEAVDDVFESADSEVVELDVGPFGCELDVGLLSCDEVEALEDSELTAVVVGVFE